MPTPISRRKKIRDVKFDTRVNASLWLDKFLVGQDENTEPKPKQTHINDVAKINTPEIYPHFFKRWKKSLVSIGAKFKNFKVEGRMIVGLGAESVLETSIALHRTYGVPFISGSALKGLAASYANKCLGDDWRKGGKAHGFVFGSQDSAGFITFHDALLIPETEKNLHADIMTVHHGDYYGDKKDKQGNLLPPADWDSPVPIPFLSATGNYLVAISIVKGETQEETEILESWIEFVWQILVNALQEEGIGAKTSSGYGRGTLSELPLSEEEKHAANANLLEAGVNQLITEIQSAQGSGKEAKDKLKVIATKHINKGNMPDEYKQKLAKAMCEKVEALQLDLRANDWFTRVQERNKT